MRACFNGCSFTVGEGFPVEQRELFIYDRLVSRHFNVDHTNIAQGGASNYNIFMRSLQALLSNKYDIMFVQWSALNRIWLSPGPEVYFFVNDDKYPDFTYRDLYLNKHDKNFLKKCLLLLNHDYQNILDLIDYCSSLLVLAHAQNTKIFFINGIVPWTDDLTKPLGPDLESTLSNYTKNILDFDNRNDHEVVEFFLKLQTKFKELDQTKWINLFDSLQENTIDHGPEGHHPGINSHQWMANKIINYIEENNIL